MIYTILDFILEMLERAVRGIANWGHRIAAHVRNGGRWIRGNAGDLLRIATTLMIAILIIGFINEWNQLRNIQNVQTVIIANQSKQINAQKAEIAALSSHVDCLFTLATHPNHGTIYIANPANCVISTQPAASNSSSSVGTAPISQNSSKTNSGQTGANVEPQSDNSSDNSKKNNIVTIPPVPKCTIHLIICL